MRFVMVELYESDCLEAERSGAGKSQVGAGTELNP